MHEINSMRFLILALWIGGVKPFVLREFLHCFLTIGAFSCVLQANSIRQCTLKCLAEKLF